ncbi:MAG TPA: diadenylate cyclase CdaA [Thermodesulfobacteriota bacterium]|nr:diadenylate cyclase CdaA [Thermodesulfobacteriota bacterium]
MIEAIFSLNTLVAAVDIMIVAFAIYWLMLMVRGTRAERMLWGLGVVVIAYFVSLRAELVTFHWILSNFLSSIIIFIIVVFQQDIRRALVHMGQPFIQRETFKSREVVEEISRAVIRMSRARTGGIIVVERSVDLGDLLDTGIETDARVSGEIIRAIFDQGSPMHDGAVIIKGARIYKAGCILPLSGSELAESVGTRHRAALGIAEETDAVSIVVSERTGEIALAVDYELHVGIKPEDLLGRLRNLLPGEGTSKKSLRTILPWKVGV